MSTNAELWARHGDEMRAVLATAPPLSPTQVREIRHIWLGIKMRQAAEAARKATTDE